MTISSNQPSPLPGGAVLGGRAIIQEGFIVDDLEAAVKHWVGLGVGPFFILPHLELDRVVFKGEVIKPDVSIALCHAGGLQLELMVQHNDTPGVWKDPSVPLRGVHHMAFMVDDYDAAVEEMAEQGVPLMQSIETRGLRTAYLDGMDTYGFLWEIQERKPALTELNDVVEAASRNWDGSDPIRSFDW